MKVGIQNFPGPLKSQLQGKMLTGFWWTNGHIITYIYKHMLDISYNYVDIYIYTSPPTLTAIAPESQKRVAFFDEFETKPFFFRPGLCCELFGRLEECWLFTWISDFAIPIGSMYGIFTYIYHKNQPNVGKYTIHGSYGIFRPIIFFHLDWWRFICRKSTSVKSNSLLNLLGMVRSP